MGQSHELTVRNEFGGLPEAFRISIGGLRPSAWCFHNASMPNVLVRNIPDDVHAALQRRAERRGQSFQQYLAAELARLASQPSIDELFERVGRRRGGRVGLRTAVEDLDADRADR